jgi:septum formation protein
MMTNYPNLDRLLFKYKLLLASGSPRRVQILGRHGISFRQFIPDIDENNIANMAPYQLTVKLAKMKALAVKALITDEEIALGCDTIVILNDEVLSKPASPENAIEMLTSLSGNMHTVCSAIALLNAQGKIVSGYEFTDVYFKKTTKFQIEEYVASGEPLDKAGAYGIQELGGFLVDRIDGNIDNVIGLPMTLLDKLAGEIF